MEEFIKNFTPEDGAAWKNWDLSSSLFDHFFILGPSDINQDFSAPTILDEFPPLNASKEYQIDRFLFDDGLKFQDIKISKVSNLVESYISPNQIIDQVMLMKTDAGSPIFMYCTIFRASSITQPSIYNPKILDALFKCRKMKSIPTSLFAFCFISRHPFFDLLFSISRSILEMEAFCRADSLMISLLKGNKQWDNTTDPIFLWPCTGVNLRTDFLRGIYEIHLPTFGGTFAICSNNFFSPLTWIMPHPEEISFLLVLYGFQPLLNWIEIDDFVKLLSCILLESNVVVVGDKLSEIVKTVTFLTQIISPFIWMCPIINILPLDLLEILDSPFPNIVGITRHNFPVHRNFKNIVFINLDIQRIDFPEPLLLIPWHDELTQQIQPFFDKRVDSVDTDDVNNLMQNLELFIANNITRMMKPFLEARYDNSGNFGTMFIKDPFISTYMPEYRPFIRDLVETQLFAAFKEQLCRENTESVMEQKDFDRLMTRGEWLVKVDARNNEHGVSEFCFNHTLIQPVTNFSHFNNYRKKK